MEILTAMTPIFVNKTKDGSYDYGFVTGKKNKDSGFFENAGIIIRNFPKAQKFKFGVPVECMVSIGDGKNAESSGTVKRFGRKQKPVSVSGGDDISDFEFSDEE